MKSGSASRLDANLTPSKPSEPRSSVAWGLGLWLESLAQFEPFFVCFVGSALVQATRLAASRERPDSLEARFLWRKAGQQ